MKNVSRLFLAGLLVTAIFQASVLPALADDPPDLTNLAAGNFYYVSTTGNDANPGTQPLPWRTIHKAAKTVHAGDTVYIRGGTYNEATFFYVSGTQSAPITIAGYPGESVFINGSNYTIPPKSSGRGLIQLEGNWIIVRNLTISYSGDMGAASYGDHNTFDNIFTHHNWGSGILMSGDHNTTVNSRIWSNSMMNEYHVMSNSWSPGITCARYPDYCTIRKTVSWENWGEGISTFESMHVIIEDNISFDNQQNIYISDTKYLLFQRNFSYCTPGNTIDAYETQNGILVGDEKGVPIPLGSNGTRYPSSDNTFLNNIVYGCDINLQTNQNQAANNLYAYNTFVNSKMPNQANVIFNPGSAPGQRFINNIVLQNNNLPIIELNQPGVISFSHNLWSKTPRPGATGPGDIIGDPKLAMLGSPNSQAWFSLTSASPAIDKALQTTETNVDYFNINRGAYPDMGAIEFNLFADVPSDHWAKAWIEDLFNAGITTGCNTAPLMYCPSEPVTRAQMSVFLLRCVYGRSYVPPTATGNVFPDVPSSFWAAGWIEKLAADGITTSCGNGLFCPNEPVTRAQMAVFLLRTTHGASYTPPPPLGTTFSDVPANYWAAGWIEQLASEGITTGCGAGKFCPNEAVNRDQMAVFLVRTFIFP